MAAGDIAATDVQAAINELDSEKDATNETTVNAAGAVMETDFNAQTVMLAVANDTPLPVTINASTFVGRKASGDAVAMTAAEARAVLELGSDDVVVGENNAATDKTNIDAAIAAVAAESGSRKEIVVIGKIKLGAAAFSTASYITFKMINVSFDLTVAHDNVAEYFNGTDMDIEGAHELIKSGTGSTTKGFFGGRNWSGFFIKSWGSASEVTTGLQTASRIDGGGVAVGWNIETKAAIVDIKIAGQFEEYLNSAGVEATFEGGSCEKITLVGLKSRAKALDVSTSVDLTGNNTSYIGGASSSAALVLFGKDTFLKVTSSGSPVLTQTGARSQSDILAASNIVVNLSADGFECRLKALTITNPTITASNGIVEIIETSAPATATTVPLGTNNKFLYRGARIAKLTIGASSRTTAHIHHQGTAAVDTVEVGATCGKCEMYLFIRVAGGTATIKNGAAGNIIWVHADTKPVIEAGAEDNLVIWVNTDTGEVRVLTTMNGQIVSVVEQTLDHGAGVNPITTTIEAPIGAILMSSSSKVAESYTVTGGNAPFDILQEWDAGAMTDPSVITSVVKNTGKTSDSFIEKVDASGSLTLTVRDSGAAALTGSNIDAGQTAVLIAYREAADIPDFA